MDTELVRVIDTMSLAIWLGVGMLTIIAINLGVLVKVLRDIHSAIRDLVAETAYLATVEDTDESEDDNET
jgi:SpoU rRNA methylase family enzyme